jgi:cobalt/nickel transport system ATP-binding protein
MIHIIKNLLNSSCCHTRLGIISVWNVDDEIENSLSTWIESRQNRAIGAIGTRAKQRAHQELLTLDFSYGVIDKCILRALRGLDSLILTPGSMVDRVTTRVDAYCQESGNTIAVISVNPINHSPIRDLVMEEALENEPS